MCTLLAASVCRSLPRELPPKRAEQATRPSELWASNLTSASAVPITRQLTSGHRVAVGRMEYRCRADCSCRAARRASTSARCTADRWSVVEAKEKEPVSLAPHPRCAACRHTRTRGGVRTCGTASRTTREPHETVASVMNGWSAFLSWRITLPAIRSPEATNSY